MAAIAFVTLVLGACSSNSGGGGISTFMGNATKQECRSAGLDYPCHINKTPVQPKG